MNISKLLILCSTLTLTAAELHLRYSETTADVQDSSQVSITTYRDRIETRFQNDEQEIFSQSYLNGGTYFSKQIAQDDTVTILRKGRTITIDYGDEAIQKKIDESAWLGDLSNLKNFVLSGEKEMRFWIVSSNFSELDGVKSGFDVLKFKLQRKEATTISQNGIEIPVVHYVLSMADWRSIFWKADYWFDSDGIAQRSSMKRGGPFTPKTVVSLISKEGGR